MAAKTKMFDEKQSASLIKWFDELMVSLNAIKPTTPGAPHILETEYGILGAGISVKPGDGGYIHIKGLFHDNVETMSIGRDKPVHEINGVPLHETSPLNSTKTSCKWELYDLAPSSLKAAKEKITAMFEPEGLGVKVKSKVAQNSIDRKAAFIEMIGSKEAAEGFALALLENTAEELLPAPAVRVKAGNKPTADYWKWVSQKWWLNRQTSVDAAVVAAYE